jgi:parallel beta-helix repeat protein
MRPYQGAVCAALGLLACGRLEYQRSADLDGETPRVDGAIADGSPRDADVVPSDAPPIAIATVVPVYPSAARWNAYVRREIAAAPTWAQPGSPCDRTALGPPSSCVHGGELRSARFETLASCDGVQVRDELGALQWMCDDADGAVTVRSTGLRPNARLSTLIDPSVPAFRANRVIVTLPGGATAASEPSVWWDNPVRPLPPAPTTTVSLDEAMAIYVLAGSASAVGYVIRADGIALVVMPGSALAREGTAGNCSDTLSVETGSSVCLVAARSVSFLWLEGSFEQGDEANRALVLWQSRFSVLRGVRVGHFLQRGIQLSASSGCTLYDVVTSRVEVHGIELENAHDNVLHRVVASNAGRATSSGLGGILLSDSDRNVITRATAISNSQIGIFLYDGSDDVTISHATTLHSLAIGILAQSPGVGATIAQALVLHQGGTGIDVHQSVVADVAASGGAVAVRRTDASSAMFYNLVTEGGAQRNCELGAGDFTCPPGLRLATGVDFSAVLRLKLTTDDVVSRSDVDGAAARAAITDWASFEHPLRAWGEDGGAFPDAAQLGPCVSDCRIWDARVVADATRARPIAVRDDTGAQVLDGVVAGAACPRSVHGDHALTDARGDTFLVHALEHFGDGIGDDDGLCESSETCIASRYYGADQGDSGEPAEGACVFTGGSVSAVRMLGWLP